MPVRVLAGHPLIRETAGQVCYARGPLVYCAEEADNGPDLHLLRARPEAQAAVERLEIGGVSLPALRVAAGRLPRDEGPLYRPWKEAEPEDVRLTLIPYFAWANRGRGEMRVWLRL